MAVDSRLVLAAAAGTLCAGRAAWISNGRRPSPVVQVRSRTGLIAACVATAIAGAIQASLTKERPDLELGVVAGVLAGRGALWLAAADTTASRTSGPMGLIAAILSVAVLADIATPPFLLFVAIGWLGIMLLDSAHSTPADSSALEAQQAARSTGALAALFAFAAVALASARFEASATGLTAIAPAALPGILAAALAILLVVFEAFAPGGVSAVQRLPGAGRAADRAAAVLLTDNRRVVAAQAGAFAIVTVLGCGAAWVVAHQGPNSQHLTRAMCAGIVGGMIARWLFTKGGAQPADGSPQLYDGFGAMTILAAYMAGGRTAGMPGAILALAAASLGLISCSAKELDSAAGPARSARAGRILIMAAVLAGYRSYLRSVAADTTTFELAGDYAVGFLIAGALMPAVCSGLAACGRGQIGINGPGIFAAWLVCAAFPLTALAISGQEGASALVLGAVIAAGLFRPAEQTNPGGILFALLPPLLLVGFGQLPDWATDLTRTQKVQLVEVAAAVIAAVIVGAEAARSRTEAARPRSGARPPA